jgi:hypothetical protein
VAPGVPIADENRIVVPDILGTAVKITTKPAWSGPAHVASAGYGQRVVPLAQIEGLSTRCAPRPAAPPT